MALCDFCFRDKNPLQPPFPRATVGVCKACAYQIERVLGFLRHSGAVVVKQGELENPPTPQGRVAKSARAKINPLKTERGATE